MAVAVYDKSRESCYTTDGRMQTTNNLLAPSFISVDQKEKCFHAAGCYNDKNSTRESAQAFKNEERKHMK